MYELKNGYWTKEEFAEWTKTLPNFEARLVKHLVKVFLEKGNSQREAMAFAELSYMEYKNNPTTWLLNQ